MKKIWSRRRVAAVCAIAVLGSVLTGCGDDNKDEVGGISEFDWFINMQQWETSGDLWDTADILQEVVQKLGVKPNVSIPTGSGSEKINLMLATGDMPDLLTWDATDKQIEQFIKADAMYTIDELCEKYDSDIEIPDEVRLFGASRYDNVLYGLPSYLRTDWQIEQKQDLSTVAWLVRTDAYEALGSPDMSTPEGL